MLFQLSDLLVKYSPQDEEWVLNSVAKVLNCYREGYIIVTASVIVCDFFKKKYTDDKLLKVLNYIDQHRIELPSVLWRTTIVLDNPDLSKHEIGLSYFDKSNCLFIPFFVSENLNDIELYDIITRSFYRESCLFYYPSMGGGSTTYKVIKKIRPFGFVLAIVDSDRKYDKADLGDTASHCQKVIKVNDSFAHLKVLDIHEVENLLPLSAIRKVSMNRESRQFFNKVLATKYYDFLPFFDYKGGVCVKDMKNRVYRQYAETIYSHLYCKNKQMVKDEFLTYLQQCQKTGENVFPGFRRDLVDSFLNRFAGDKNGCYLDVLTYDCFRDVRNEIADLVFTFCCARGITPIN